uniref:Col-145 protein n=2 Tax=Endopterygota TaxID=33392 RepID=A0A0C9RSS6_9HYME
MTHTHTANVCKISAKSCSLQDHFAQFTFVNVRVKMQSILKLRYAVALLLALNCVLLCAAQGNGGWGGSSGAPGAPGGGNGGGAPGAPGAPGGSSGGYDGAPGAPGAPADGYYGHQNHMNSSAGFAQLQWLLALLPLAFLLKYA